MKTLLLFVTGLAACYAADKPDIAGDWKGTLKTQGPELRLVLHLQKAGDGLKATLDSIDQGANGIPVATADLKGRQLHLDIPAVKGTYDADVSADGKTLTGKWLQPGVELPLAMTRGSDFNEAPSAAKSATVAPLIGVWDGTLDAGSSKLRVRFTLKSDDKGQISGKFDSLDQGAMGIPMSEMSLAASDFHFDIRGVGGKYDGKVSADKQTIKGTWYQGGAALPLEFTKSAASNR
jgi:hypothetical protein